MTNTFTSYVIEVSLTAVGLAIPRTGERNKASSYYWSRDMNGAQSRRQTILGKERLSHRKGRAFTLTGPGAMHPLTAFVEEGNESPFEQDLQGR